jgi:outer membrane protein assembly factor BamB
MEKKIILPLFLFLFILISPNVFALDWLQFQYDNNNTGVNPEDKTYYSFNSKWNFTTGGRLDSTPIVYSGMVYISSGDGKTYALNSTTGVQLFNVTGYAKYTSPIIKDGKLYIPTNGYLYVYYANNGTPSWNIALKNNYNVAVGKIVDDLFIVPIAQYIDVINITSRSRKCSFDMVSQNAYGHLAIYEHDGNVIAYSSSEPSRKLFAINITGNCSQVWNYTLGSGSFYGASIYNDLLYMTTGSSGTKVFYPLNGTLKFTGTGGTESVATFKDGIYVQGNGYGVAGVYANNGSTKWSYSTGTGDVTLSPIINGKLAYIGDWNGKVYALNIYTGKKVWGYSGLGVLDSLSLAISNGYLYVPSTGTNKLYAFEGIEATEVGYCGTLNTADTIYVLNQSISASGICFTVSASNITLDCDGYVVTGSGSQVGVRFDSTSTNSEIYNCTFTHFQDGIYASNRNLQYFRMNNVNVSYNTRHGVYLYYTDNSMITNSVISDNCVTPSTPCATPSAYGLYIRNTDDSYLYNLTLDRNNFGLYSSTSHRNTFESVTANGNQRRGVMISGDNNTANNIYVNGTYDPLFSLGYGLYLSGVNISVSDSVSENNQANDVYISSATGVCQTANLSNVTITDGFSPEIYTTQTTVQNKKSSLIYFCGADNSIVKNVTIDTGNNGLYSYYTNNLTISDYTCNNCMFGLDFESFYPTGGQNVTIRDSKITNPVRGGIYLGLRGTDVGIAENITIIEGTFGLGDGYVTIRDSYFYSPSVQYSVIDNAGNVTLNLYDSIVFGNYSALSIDDRDGRYVVYNIYNSKINRSSATAYDDGFGLIFNGSVCSYCQSSCGTGIFNVYNSSITDYDIVNGSTLNKYWYLSVSNPLSANAIIKDVFGSSVFTFSDSRIVPLLEYQVTEFNNRTEQTPHTIQATKSGYNPLSPQSLTMNTNRDYTISLSQITGLPDFFKQLAVIPIAIIMFMSLALKLLESMSSNKMFISMIIAFVIGIVLIVALFTF